MLSFYDFIIKLNEAGEQPPMAAPPGGDPMGGGGPDLGGGMPMGGGGMPPMGGGMPGEQPPAGEPVKVDTIKAADVWGLLNRIVRDEKFDSFFTKININKNEKSEKPFLNKKSSLEK